MSRPLSSPLFPYTTLFRSEHVDIRQAIGVEQRAVLIANKKLEQAGVASPRGEQFERRGTVHRRRDRKSTRLNSSHVAISYAVFCVKKKKARNAAGRFVDGS